MGTTKHAVVSRFAYTKFKLIKWSPARLDDAAAAYTSASSSATDTLRRRIQSQFKRMAKSTADCHLRSSTCNSRSTTIGKSACESAGGRSDPVDVEHNNESNTLVSTLNRAHNMEAVAHLATLAASRHVYFGILDWKLRDTTVETANKSRCFVLERDGGGWETRGKILDVAATSTVSNAFGVVWFQTRVALRRRSRPATNFEDTIINVEAIR